MALLARANIVGGQLQEGSTGVTSVSVDGSGTYQLNLETPLSGHPQFKPSYPYPNVVVSIRQTDSSTVLVQFLQQGVPTTVKKFQLSIFG